MSTSTAVSARKLAANRANAARSTGPRTAEGKARSSRNAVIHGFYSSTLLLEGEDPAERDQLRDQLLSDLRPHGPAEFLIVERLVSLYWKLRRLHETEQLMLNQRLKLLRKHSQKAQRDESPDASAALAEMIYDGTELERLSLYERRLDGGIHRCLRELRLLRKDRDQRPVEEPEETTPETSNEYPVTEAATASAATERSPRPSPGVSGEGANPLPPENVRNEPTAACNIRSFEARDPGM